MVFLQAAGVKSTSMRAKVHLPSTSLTALTQLQESLKSPSGLLLDIADCRDLAMAITKKNHGKKIVTKLECSSIASIAQVFQKLKLKKSRTSRKPMEISAECNIEFHETS